jgi:hypothetical protein
MTVQTPQGPKDNPATDSAAASDAPMRAPPVKLTHPLPFSAWWPLLAGAITGIALRLAFSGKPGGPLAAMEGAVIYLTPMAVGAVTVYAAERRRRRSWKYYAWAPMAANALFVIGTLAILIEGLICAIIIVPLFSALGAIGGLIMGAICRMTHWPKPAVYAFAVLPLVLGVLPLQGLDDERIGSIERTVLVNAPPESIWRQIHNVRDIRPEEVDRAWIYRIGVPVPIEGVTEQTPSGLVRKITMGKHVHFEQVVAEWSENRHVRWTYHFDDDSFPPGALDDHVRIGGHYFDLIDTDYTLTPQDAGSTRLSIRIRYRVNTDFNWYADIVARLLIGNFEEVILGFYEHRAATAVKST